MKSPLIQIYATTIILLFSLSYLGCTQNTSQNTKTESAEEVTTTEKYKVTFIELGSVRCIPCQKMQPVLNSIEEKYGDQVKVVFHDVWTPEGKPFANKYNIEAIPTQVFLDEKGEEFFRHEGFFEEADLVKVLKTKGVS